MECTGLELYGSYLAQTVWYASWGRFEHINMGLLILERPSAASWSAAQPMNYSQPHKTRIPNPKARMIFVCAGIAMSVGARIAQRRVLDTRVPAPLALRHFSYQVDRHILSFNGSAECLIPIRTQQHFLCTHTPCTALAVSI